MVGLVIIIEYLVFVFMVIASFVIAHVGLMLVGLLDAYLSTEKRQPDPRAGRPRSIR